MSDLYREDFEPERSPEWSVYMTDEQFQVEDELLEEITTSDVFQFHIVVGVAGTGKTQILLSLADDLRDQKINVVYDCTESLRSYLRNCGVKISSDKAIAGSVHLVDDPATLRKLKNRYLEAINTGARAIVIAIDPFQFSERKALIKFAQYLHPEFQSEEYRNKSLIMPELFSDVVYGAKPKIHWLKTIFRQQANVGRQSLELTHAIFSANNPYILPAKKLEWENVTRSQIKGALNEISFLSDGGFVEKVFTDNPESEILKAIVRHSSRPDNWTWVKSFLVVCNPIILESKPEYSPSELPRRVENTNLHRVRFEEQKEDKNIQDQPLLANGLSLREIIRSYQGRQEDYSNSLGVRGEEFQEVIIHMTKAHYDYCLRGKEGVTTETWKRIMPLHTFITRAKRKVTLIVSVP